MNLFINYFKLELKRMIKGIPAVVLGMLIFVALFVGISFVGVEALRESNPQFNVINVALVGGEDDEYTKLAISAVESMETVKYSFNFEHTTEEKASKGLKEGIYNVIFIFPKDYVRSFMHGENATIVVRFGEGNSTVVSYVISRMSNVMSELMIDSERNIYAVEDYYDANSLEKRHEAVVDLNLSYFKSVLGRNSVFREEVVSATDELPIYTYYFCDGLVILFLLAGLQCGGLLQRRDNTLEKKLRVSGLSTSQGMFAKLMALVCTFVCIYAMVSVGAVILNQLLAGSGFMLVDMTVTEMLIGLAKASLILIPACMVILCVYELVNNRAMGVFALFIVIMVLGMISGCFYPLSFMPKIIQNISAFTVTRSMFCYVAGCLNFTPVGIHFASMMLHAIVLFAITVLVKRIQLRRAGA